MSQLKQIEAHLKEGKTLTPLEALDKFRCFRLAARVSDLRNRGIPIEVEMVKDSGKTYARYYLWKEMLF